MLEKGALELGKIFNYEYFPAVHPSNMEPLTAVANNGSWRPLYIWDLCFTQRRDGPEVKKHREA